MYICIMFCSIIAVPMYIDNIGTSGMVLVYLYGFLGILCIASVVYLGVANMVLHIFRLFLAKECRIGLCPLQIRV